MSINLLTLLSLLRPSMYLPHSPPCVHTCTHPTLSCVHTCTCSALYSVFVNVPTLLSLLHPSMPHSALCDHTCIIQASHAWASLKTRLNIYVCVCVCVYVYMVKYGQIWCQKPLQKCLSTSITPHLKHRCQFALSLYR